MDTSYHEVQTKAEIRMRDEEAARKYENDKLVHIVTRNRSSAVGAVWASATAGLGRLTERSSQAVRSALWGSSQPGEECC